MSATTPTPFKIAIPQDALDAAQRKLAAATLPPPAPHGGDEWEYGVPRAELEKLLAHWTSAYDWRTHEAALNAELPQFTLPIDVANHGELTAHFVHQRAKRAGKAVPLLFVHGWPGHFAEVRKILPLLTNPDAETDLAFDVVAPSLPGFGFSSAPTKSGFAIDQYAEFCHKIMLALGYNEYVIQGGDWGFIICHRLTHLYGPTHVKAWHTNLPAARQPTAAAWPRLYLAHLLTPYTEADKRGFARTQWFREHGYGYYLEQSTKPQTLAYSLADSPVGLLAWIYEKLVVWTDAYPWTPDEVLTWIHIYAFSHTQASSSAATSVRIYFEVARANEHAKVADPAFYNARVPLGVSVFPQEIIVVPSTWHHTLGWLVYTGRHERGGHFAAYERPQELVDDIRKTFSTPEVKARL
ncbi:epoxide hydrolase [Phanerochaete sordida]|uniref:Epoxide hydrolase n=1 Tax=Phanerochaete sordida TaxID=48140 RepID=A0A9P3LEQ8_9APHY|nr:epoxide hydrolase [Phanerochaete sordida]